MLPLKEPTHVNSWGNGLDLLSEGGDSAAMDALEDAALAPLDLVVWIFGG
jgi:hypothetical protein